ncbi:MAG TPA: hypothetical protein VIG69_12600, partial [Candidatus Methylomirabilis sp.]
RSPAQVFWENLVGRQAGGGLSFDYYRPLVAPTFALDGRLWDLRPAGYHLTNLLWYLVCVALAFLLARRLLGSLPAAGVAAAAFALHPVHVEAVAWIVARADMMAFAGAMVALLAFHRALEREASWALLAGTGAAFLSALFSKESALPVPALAVACWAFGYQERRAPAKRAAWAFVPLVLSLVLYAALRAATANAGVPPAPDRVESPTPWVLAPILLAKYVGLLLWPYPLNSYYEVPPPASAADPRLLIGLGILAALLGVTAWAMWRAHKLALALLWFLMSIVPVLQLVPLKGFVMAERYLLLPSFGFALIAGLAGEAAWRRAPTRPLRAALAGGAALVACAWLAVIMGRVPDWVEKVAFYRAMVRTSPDSAFAHNNLGQLLVADGALEEGARHLEAAIAIRPDMAYAHAGLGLARWRLGDLRGATASLERAARLRPAEPRILADLAAVLDAQGDARATLAVLHRLEGLRPAAPEVARRLSAVYRQLGDPERAAAYAARAEGAPAGGAPGGREASRPALPPRGSSP